jgi:hypothetical protein
VVLGQRRSGRPPIASSKTGKRAARPPGPSPGTAGARWTAAMDGAGEAVSPPHRRAADGRSHWLLRYGECHRPGQVVRCPYPCRASRSVRPTHRGGSGLGGKPGVPPPHRAWLRGEDPRCTNSRRAEGTPKRPRLAQPLGANLADVTWGVRSRESGPSPSCPGRTPSPCRPCGVQAGRGPQDRVVTGVGPPPRLLYRGCRAVEGAPRRRPRPHPHCRRSRPPRLPGEPPEPFPMASFPGSTPCTQGQGAGGTIAMSPRRLGTELSLNLLSRPCSGRSAFARLGAWRN